MQSASIVLIRRKAWMNISHTKFIRTLKRKHISVCARVFFAQTLCVDSMCEILGHTRGEAHTCLLCCSTQHLHREVRRPYQEMCVVAWCPLLPSNLLLATTVSLFHAEYHPTCTLPVHAICSMYLPARALLDAANVALQTEK